MLLSFWYSFCLLYFLYEPTTCVNGIVLFVPDFYYVTCMKGIVLNILDFLACLHSCILLIHLDILICICISILDLLKIKWRVDVVDETMGMDTENLELRG